MKSGVEKRDYLLEDDLKDPSCRAYEVAKFMETGVYRDAMRYIHARIVTYRDQLEAGEVAEAEDIIRGRLKQAREFLELFPQMLETLESIEAEEREANVADNTEM